MKNKEIEAINKLNDLLLKLWGGPAQEIKNNFQILVQGLNNLDQEVKQKTFEVQSKDSLLVQKDKNLKEIQESINNDEQKSFIKILPKLYPNDYPVKFENWRPDIWGKVVINKNDIGTIKENLPGFKVELLKKEFIDILPKLYPNDYPLKFENWRPDIWGKVVINRNDIESIKKHLPGFKVELLKKEFIDILPKLYPDDYPVKFENWRPDIWGKTVIAENDVESIKHWLPIYKHQLTEKLLAQQENQQFLLFNKDQEIERLTKLLTIKEQEVLNKNLIINEVLNLYDHEPNDLLGDYIEYQNDLLN